MLVIEVVLVTPSSKVTLYITDPHTLQTSVMTVHDIVKLYSLMSSALIMGDLGGPMYVCIKNTYKHDHSKLK